MPSILVKHVDKSLLAAVNYAAAMAEMTQRDWVIVTLANAAMGKPNVFTPRNDQGQPGKYAAPERNLVPFDDL